MSMAWWLRGAVPALGALAVLVLLPACAASGAQRRAQPHARAGARQAQPEPEPDRSASPLAYGPADDEALFDGFARCGKEGPTPFDGSYVLPIADPAYAFGPLVIELQGAWSTPDRRLGQRLQDLGALEVGEGRIRYGTVLREELCLYDVHALPGGELVARAVHHSDVDDEGDASLVYVRMHQARGGFAFSIADSPLETALVRAAAPVRVSSEPLRGLRWRAPKPWSRHFAYTEAADRPEPIDCDADATRAHEGVFVLDLQRTLGPRPSEPAALLGWHDRAFDALGGFSGLVIHGGHLQMGAHGHWRRDLCVVSRAREGFVAQYGSAGGAPDGTLGVRLERSGEALALRLSSAPANTPDALKAAPVLFYRRIDAEGYAGLIEPRPAPHVPTAREEKQQLVSRLLHDEGYVVLELDSRAPGVQLPSHLLGRADLQLHLGRTASTPLRAWSTLGGEGGGLSAELEIDGVLFEYRIPFDAIHGVASRDGSESRTWR